MSQSNKASSTSSSRLTSLLPTHITGGLQPSNQNHDKDTMPPPPSTKAQGSKLGLDRKRNYRYKTSIQRQESETPSHIGVNESTRERQRHRQLRRRQPNTDHDDENPRRRRRHTSRRSRSLSRSRSSSESRSSSSSDEDRRSRRRRRERDSKRSRRREGDSSRESSSRSRRRHREEYDAPTPRRDDKDGRGRRREDYDERRSQSHRSMSSRKTNSWENETPLHPGSGGSSQRQGSSRRDQSVLISASSSSSMTRMDSQRWRSDGQSQRSRDDSSRTGQRGGRITSIRAFPGGGDVTPMPTNNNAQPPNSNIREVTNVPRPISPPPEDEFDRQYYLADDDKYIPQDSSSNTNQSLGRFLFESAKTKARQEEMDQKRESSNRGITPKSGSGVGLRHAKASALQDDQNAWEENRLLSSGAALMGNVDLNAADDVDDSRVTLLVHQVRPPFL